MLIQRMRDYSTQIAGENGGQEEAPMLKLKENDSDDLEWAVVKPPN